jgi:MFS family permease
MKLPDSIALHRRDPDLYPYRHGLQFAFFNALNWQIGIGTPMVLFMEHLGASAAQVGLAYAFTFLLTPAQVLATAWLPRHGYKRLTLLGWGARGWFLAVPLGLAVAAPAEVRPWMVTAFVAAMFGYNLSRSIGAGAIVTWLLNLVPEPVRARYFSSDQVLASVGCVGTLALSSLLFAVMPAYPAFAVQYVIAGLGAWVSFRALARLPDVAKPVAIDLRRVFVETPRLMLRPGPFRRYLWLAVWFAVISTPLPPFTAYYLKAGAGLTPSRIVIFTIMQYLGVIAGNWFMRSRIDRHGSKPFFLAALAGFGLIAAGWWTLLHWGAGAAGLPFALYFLLGAASGMWGVANLNYLPRLLPEAERALPVALHAALTAFMGGVSAVAWGAVLKGGGGAPSVSLAAFQVFFAVTFGSAVLLLLLTRRLDDQPGAAGSLLPLSLLLRPFRGITYLATLFLALPSVRRAEERDGPPR